MTTVLAFQPRHAAQRDSGPLGTRSAGRARGFTLSRLDQIPTPPRRDEIVGGLLAAGEIAALSGPPGSGKSAVATLLATCIAEGRHFLGRRVWSGPVIYIAAERFIEATRRLIAIGSGQAPVFVSRERPNLAEPTEIGYLAEAIVTACTDEGIPPALVIFDTAARCMVGLDENSARDVGRVIDGLTRLSELIPSAAIVLLHHVSKGTGDLRGSTALLGGIDLDLGLEGSGSLRRLVVRKANAVAEGQVLGFELVPMSAAGDELSVITARAADVDTAPTGRRISARAGKILDLIAEMNTGGSVLRQELLDATRSKEILTGRPNATRMAFVRSLEELEKAGRIELNDERVLLHE
jgi:KaiC/GvpD/RAD55 family RecA-like ATPase